MDIEDMDLGELIARREELANLRLDDHECGKEVALRRRTVAGGAVQLVRQCLVCGRALGGPLSTTAAAAQLQGAEAPAFDDTVGEERRARPQR